MKRVIPLVVILLVIWAAADYGYDWAAETLGSTPQRWQYILAAFKSFALGVLVAIACRHWLPAGLALGCSYDEALKFTCGGIRLYDPAPWMPRPGEGLCDALGIHINMVGLALVAFFAVVIGTHHEQSPT